MFFPLYFKGYSQAVGVLLLISSSSSVLRPQIQRSRFQQLSQREFSKQGS